MQGIRLKGMAATGASQFLRPNRKQTNEQLRKHPASRTSREVQACRRLCDSLLPAHMHPFWVTSALCTLRTMTLWLLCVTAFPRKMGVTLELRAHFVLLFNFELS